MQAGRHARGARLLGRHACACWEVLAFSGRFDVARLTEALHGEGSDDPLGAFRDDEVAKEERRRLHHNKAEAIARFNEGERLDRAAWSSLRRAARRLRFVGEEVRG